MQNIQDAIEAYAMATGSISTRKYAKQYKRGNWIKRENTSEEVSEALLSEPEAEFAKIEIPKRNGDSVK